MKGSGGSAGMGGGDMSPEIVMAVDEEKMAAMQEALEKDKLTIRKQFEKEKQKLQAQTAITEEEREKLLAELEVQQKAQ